MTGAAVAIKAPAAALVAPGVVMRFGRHRLKPLRDCTLYLVFDQLLDVDQVFFFIG